jgi:hypothetical protein
LDFIYRDEQLATTVVEERQLVKTDRPAVNDFLDDRTNQAGALIWINHLIPTGQYHSILLPRHSREQIETPPDYSGPIN